MSADEDREHYVRLQVPPPAADVYTQRVQLLRLILNLSSTTDQEKYNDVLASVDNWHDLDMHAVEQLNADRTHGEPQSLRNKGARGA